MKRYQHRLTAFTAILLPCLPVFAAPVDDARALAEGGDYGAAEEILAAELAARPSQNGAFFQLLGECRFHLGDYAAAREALAKARTKGVADAYRWIGRLDYLDYDFDAASQNYSKYRQLKNKARKPIDDEADSELERLETARGFLNRVEHIAIIDSIAVDRNDFFRAYRMPPSAGSLLPPSELPFEDSRDLASTVWANESRDAMMWAEPDSLGTLRIMESVRLTDGSWQTPMTLDDMLNDGGDADFPFMMPDGLTLYYASDGNGSIGGYDIFVASRDAATGEYLQPSNIGMPYNSPYDDYMLAIDELNGVGWWATDRNRLGDKVTVYLFVTNDMRRNYDPEEEDVVSAARIDRIADTLDPDTDYAPLLAHIRSIDPDMKPRRRDFTFPLPGGGSYTTLDDFPSDASRKAMSAYLDACRRHDALLDSVAGMRRQYAGRPSADLGRKIAAAETELEKSGSESRRLRSEVYKLLGNRP